MSLENLQDFANRFTHTHEGENVLRAYRVMFASLTDDFVLRFPQQFNEAVGNTVILERALGDQEPALEALTKVGEIEFLLEETTIKDLQLSDLMKKRNPIYRKIDKKSRQISLHQIFFDVGFFSLTGIFQYGNYLSPFLGVKLQNI